MKSANQILAMSLDDLRRLALRLQVDVEIARKGRAKSAEFQIDLAEGRLKRAKKIRAAALLEIR